MEESNGIPINVDAEKATKAFRIDMVQTEDGTFYEAVKYKYCGDQKRLLSSYKEAEERGLAYLNKKELPQLEEYQQRLVNEYLELSVKLDKLGRMLDKWDDLDFEPECSFEQLKLQESSMFIYKQSLEARSDFKKLQAMGYLDDEFYC